MLGAWAEEVRADEPELADAWSRASILADGGARLMVLAELLDEPDDPTIALAETVVLAEPNSYFGMPFDEAVEFLERRGVVTPDEMRALRDRYQAEGFGAARIASESVVARVKEHLERLLSAELTMEEAVAEILATPGVTGTEAAKPWYAQLVARNAVASAYGAGRYRQVTEPGVAALRPFAQYRTIGDSRVRHVFRGGAWRSHRILGEVGGTGLVVAVGSAAFNRYSPPGGHNCRCAWATLSARQVELRRLEVFEGSVYTFGGAEVRFDQGWEGPPVTTQAA